MAAKSQHLSALIRLYGIFTTFGNQTDSSQHYNYQDGVSRCLHSGSQPPECWRRVQIVNEQWYSFRTGLAWCTDCTIGINGIPCCCSYMLISTTFLWWSDWQALLSQWQHNRSIFHLMAWFTPSAVSCPPAESAEVFRGALLILVFHRFVSEEAPYCQHS